MQPGFAARKGKANAKKRARQQKKQKLQAAKNLKGDDVEMGEAGGSGDGSIDYEFHKEDAGPKTGGSHKNKVQLKRSLKVKVAQLKQARNKLTKLPAHKAERKSLTADMKQLLEQRSALNQKGQKGAVGAPAPDTMAE